MFDAGQQEVEIKIEKREVDKKRKIPGSFTDPYITTYNSSQAFLDYSLLLSIFITLENL